MAGIPDIIRRSFLRYSVVLFFCVIPFFQVLGFSSPTKGITNSDPQTEDPFKTKEFELSGPGILKVFTVSGDIDIVPSSSTDKVKVELYLDRGFAFWSHSQNLDNFRITMLKRGNEIVASVERKQRETSFFGDRMSFSFRVYVPKDMSSELTTQGGNISLKNVHGRQYLKTGGGEITAQDVSGKLQAYTSGGNIEIKHSRGTIYAQTEGGNIYLDRSSGEMRLRSKGGRIVSERLSGALIAKVGGGDIQADFMQVGEGINLETSAGNIQLTVPQSNGYELFLKGTEIDFPDPDQFRGEITMGRVEGIYKQGGPPINLSTNAGKVKLKIK